MGDRLAERLRFSVKRNLNFDGDLAGMEIGGTRGFVVTGRGGSVERDFVGGRWNVGLGFVGRTDFAFGFRRSIESVGFTDGESAASGRVNGSCR